MARRRDFFGPQGGFTPKAVVAPPPPRPNFFGIGVVSPERRNNKRQEGFDAMNNENESILQVPISDEAKAALQERAAANGRAMGREAQQILNKTLLKNPKAA